MSEAFLAHTLVQGEEGGVVRVIEQLDGRGDWRALFARRRSGPVIELERGPLNRAV